MARNERRRVKKLERKRTERKGQHSQAARLRSASAAVRMAAAASWPILGAHETMTEDGKVSCVLARRGPAGVIAVGMFLLDLYCLGVKDAWSKLVTGEEYARILERFEEIDCEEIAPSRLRKLVEGAVEYAEGLGLAPHSGYASTAFLLGDIDATECTEEMEFGCNGKPLFLQGPYDSDAFCDRVMATLGMDPDDMRADEFTGQGLNDFFRHRHPDLDNMLDEDDQDDDEETEVADSEILFEEPADVIEVTGTRTKG